MATTTRYTGGMTHEEAEHDMAVLRAWHREYLAQQERDLRAVIRQGDPPGGASVGKTAWAAARAGSKEVIGRTHFRRLRMRDDGSVVVKP